ncbi:MAG: hypothetical protein OXM54_10225, partial [Acidimicrobiaceae bacterium]|nr:hypothetical protein [Acidimicrobiaceae bacterium]
MAAVLLAAGLLVPVAVVPAAAQTPPPVDYDVDDDGLIEISSLAQLNAIRWDLDGDGAADVYPPSRDGRTGHDPDGAAKLSAAFPNAATDMGCPADGCDGYELAADLDFDTNGSGTADSGDEFWNGGKGWVPLIGGEAIYGWEAELRFEDAAAPKVYGDSPHSRARMFTAVFEGNGRTIANLYIDDPNRWLVGLFGAIGPGAHVRNFGLSAPNADSRVRGNEYVGPLAGQVQGGRVTQGGRVSGVWSGVDVSGSVRVGGLVGVVAHHSFVIESYAVGDVSGNREVGGLVGLLNYSGVAASYAAGDVSGSRHVGGLAGLRPDGHARATYATGSVTRTQGAPLRWADGFGGLIGSLWHAYTAGWPRASYATGQVSVPDGVAAGGLMGECLYSDRPRAEGGNYWDTEATGLATSPGCGVGYTTAELQAPTGYEGIYADWDVDVDVGANYGWAFLGPGDDPWDFGSSSEYPVLKYCADKPGIDTVDGLPFCPLQPWRQR